MKKNEILLIFISLFTLTVVWIAFSIYHNSIASTIPEATNIRIAPIAPDFDTETIDKLKQRKDIEPFTEAQLPIQIPEVEEKQEATESGETDSVLPLP